VNKKKIVIIGAGGHAKVIVDILRGSPFYEAVGCLDAAFQEKDVAGVKVIGDDRLLPELYQKGITGAFVAIGDNRLRVMISRRVANMGFELINAVSLHSVLSSSVRMGQGIAVMPGAVINVDVQVRDNAIINTGACVDHDCLLGEGCHIAPGCFLAGNVIIGEGAFLGVGCKVIPRVKIGVWSVAGAGAVVTKDLPPYSMAVGVPARVIRNLEEYGK
jgi:UDP-perosamine 4-acetyltransferase